MPHILFIRVLYVGVLNKTRLILYFLYRHLQDGQDGLYFK